MRKRCTKCEKDRELKSFSKRKASKDGLNHWCKQCVCSNNLTYKISNREKVRKASREYWQNNPDKAKEKQLKYMFGIDLAQYNTLLKAQNNACAICKKDQSLFIKSLAVDHCHTTGKIRGLLCGGCNRAIGILNDSIELCLSAANYLSRSMQEDA